MRKHSYHELRDAIGHNVATAQDAATSLSRIADAMSTLGIMGEIVNELDAIGRDIVASAKNVQGAHGQKLTDDLRESEEFAFGLLKATLAGCVVPAKESAP